MENQGNQSTNSYPDHSEDYEGSQYSSSEVDGFSEVDADTELLSLFPFTSSFHSDNQPENDATDEVSDEQVISNQENLSDTYSSEYYDDYEESSYSASDMEDFSEFDLPIE